MYIGSTGERGLHHLVYEVVDNSVDEALAGHCDHIAVTLLADGGVRVEDNGRGIPTDMHEGEGVPAVTLALTLLHAGGKFGGGGYKVSGGLHGVGVSVVNALSTRLQVDVRNRGHHWRQTFTYGVPDAPLEQLEETDETGTTVTFWASEDIFETTHYSFETLTSRFREMAFLNKGLEIVVRDERLPAPGHGRGGRRGRGVDRQRRRRRPVGQRRARAAVPLRRRAGRLRQPPQPHPRRRAPQRHLASRRRPAASRGDSALSLELAMQWNTGFTESVHTFANTINTHEGGTHEEGFRAALTTTVNTWAEQWGLVKKREDRVSGDDVREGLTAIISIKLAEPQFEGQTKTKLGNTEARSFVQKARQRPARCLAGGEPGRGQGHRAQGDRGRYRADRRAQGPRPRPQPQGPARWWRAARQARRLPVQQPRRVRAVRRRGQLGGRLGQGRPRPAYAGDPADPRQDPQRREGPHRPGAGQHRGAVDHLRPRHRHPRGLRPRQAALRQGHLDGRRRRRRPAHLHPAAHAAVPVHAAADRERPRLSGPAAAVQDQVDQLAARAGVLRAGARRPAGRRAPRRASDCPRTARSSATRASAR